MKRKLLDVASEVCGYTKVENEWSDSIDASKVEGTVRKVDIEEVQCAMNHIKFRKASGPSVVAIELFQAGGDKCLKFLTNI